VSFDVDTSGDVKLYLTATGRNLYPFEAEIEVYEEGAPVDTGEPTDDTGDPDIPDDTDRPPTGVAPGGQCGCGAPGLPAAAPFALLLLPLWTRRRRSGRAS
jgi:uncharacterized protein (TIGR03382 family)